MKMVDMHSIKCKLETEVCPQHNQKAVVSVIGEKLNFKCCCDSFKDTLGKIAQKEISAQSRKYVEDEIRKAFKM